MIGQANFFRRIIEVPVSDPDDARRRQLLNVILLVVVFSTLLLLGVLLLVLPTGQAGSPGEVRAFLVSIGLSLLGVGLVYLLNRYVSGRLASTLFLCLLVFLGTISDEPMQVVNGRGLLLFSIPIFAASVLLEPWASFVWAGLSGLIILLMGRFIGHQAIPNIPAVVVFFIFATLSYLSAWSLERALMNLRVTNDALKESEKRFSAFMDHLPAAAFIKDRNSQVLYANRYMQQTFDVDIEDWDCLSPRDYLPEGTAAAVIADDQLTLADGPLTRQEVSIVHHGEEHFYQVLKFPIARDIDEGEGGLLLGGIALDITERVKAKEKLREHQQSLEETIEERTTELRKLVNMMAGREVRMTGLKDAIKKLRTQLQEAGLEPVADDPLLMKEG